VAKIPGKELDRYYCEYCNFACKLGRDAEGDYGMGSWDFTDGDTTGDALITNGTFDTNTTSWTEVGCTKASIAGGQSSKCARLTRASGTSQYIYQALSGLTFGQMYRFTAYVKSGTSGAEAFALRVLWNSAKDSAALHVDPSLIQSKTGTTTSTWTQYTVDWRATGSDNVVALVKNTETAGTMLFDTVTVYGYIFKARESMSACPLCGSKAWRKTETY